MKIGITCYPTYGGSGAVATELGLFLAERGHEVHFVSYAQPFRLGQYRERVYFHEVEMDEYPLFEHPPYSLALAVAIHDAVRKHDLDVFHVHYAIPHATSAWIAREMLGESGLPVVTTLHGTDITLVGLHPSFHGITRFSILKSDAITAVSSYLKEQTVRDFGVPAERVDVVPNFVDTKVYHPGKEPCHRETLAPDGEKIIMHISNFRAVKRVLDTVEVLARVTKRIPARLILIGDGPERPRVQALAEELDVADKVVFLGRHDSVAELLSCADVFLLPSSKESFGLVALEAMACGVPVVATDLGGLPEVVPHGEAGFLCSVGDVDAMADAVTDILRDEELHTRLATNGLAVVAEKFTAEFVVPQYEEIYRRVIEESGRG